MNLGGGEIVVLVADRNTARAGHEAATAGGIERREGARSDIVADRIVEISSLEPQAVIGRDEAIERVVDAELPGLGRFGLQIGVGQEREDDTGGVQAAHQRFGGRGRTVAFGIGAIDLQTGEGTFIEGRDADGNARRDAVARGGVRVALQTIGVIAQRADDLEPVIGQLVLDIGAPDGAVARGSIDVAAAGR